MSAASSSAYQVLAFDLDGTLLGRDLQIRPASIAAINAARAAGMTVVLVTGRHHIMARPYHQQLGLDTPLLACNGTYAWDFARNEAHFARPLTAKEALRLLALTREYDVHALLYLQRAQAYQAMEPHLAHLLEWAAALPASVRPELIHVPDLLPLVSAEPLIWKYAVSSQVDGRIDAFITRVKSELGLACERSGPNRVDVASAGNSKGALLQKWLAAEGIAASATVAFGDNHNDISMLQGVGLGVAMGNAEAAVQSRAARVIGDHDTDTIARFLEDTILPGVPV
ncbi:pyridoxal phosphatase [Silvimonas iriomotensis]|uniref:Pyridoxal phosphatase n=1 Tax=Silvimonas iriomotensis TaxID=449662 RepID=A0ABQ2P4D6_9NEIS|nr:pyridoxal phosphatase [Silvimonas iriomotensis]GGP17810.1 pyridoxal phosphatase [Silvimonas iriomotensis]